LSNRLINISDGPANGKDLCELFDAELRTALVGGDIAIALCLRPEMGACVALIDWLVKWQQTLSKSNRKFIIVAPDPVQRQYLELTHPDYHLITVSSVEELFFEYPQFNVTEGAAVISPFPQTVVASAPLPPAVSAPVPAPAQKTDAGLVAPPPAAPVPQQTVLPVSDIGGSEQKLLAGQVARISGEYACIGCSATRMYAKGDSASECANPECPNHKIGWKLIFELF
jgi:hypothetical protein